MVISCQFHGTGTAVASRKGVAPGAHVVVEVEGGPPALRRIPVEVAPNGRAVVVVAEPR